MKQIFFASMIASFAGCAVTEYRLVNMPFTGKGVSAECRNADKVGLVCCEAVGDRCRVMLCRQDGGEYSIAEFSCE